MLSFASQYDIKVNGQGQTIYFGYLGFGLFHKVTQRKWCIDYIEKTLKKLQDGNTFNCLRTISLLVNLFCIKTSFNFCFDYL